MQANTCGTFFKGVITMKLFSSLLILSLAILSMAGEVAPLPVFSLPALDSRNAIVEVFHERSADGSKISVTVVFKDEDHPCWLADIPYDIYRFFRYGRIFDIETFYLYLNADGSLQGIEFPGVYAGDHRFEDTRDLHGSAYITADEILFLEQRPVVYVNTWNHMFGPKPSFDRNAETLLFEYPLSPGGRDAAEVKYSWHW